MKETLAVEVLPSLLGFRESEASRRLGRSDGNVLATRVSKDSLGRGQKANDLVVVLTDVHALHDESKFVQARGMRVTIRHDKVRMSNELLQVPEHIPHDLITLLWRGLVVAGHWEDDPVPAAGVHEANVLQALELVRRENLRN